MSARDGMQGSGGRTRFRYSTLLWSLVILFVLYPVMHRWGLGSFWSLLFIAQLLLTVYAVSEDTRALKTAVIFVTPAVLGELSFFLFDNRQTHWLAALSVGAFLAYVVIVIYRKSVFGEGKVTADRIAGAVSVYLLVGLLWALAYGIVSVTVPGSFTGVEPMETGRSGAQMDFIYFSFVTLTTLGYGDITPLSATARTLAWLEAVFGQLFLAVTIARLVSLEIAHRERPPTAS